MKRFISNGGRGQAAGAGKVGLPGSDAHPIDNPMICQFAYHEICDGDPYIHIRDKDKKGCRDGALRWVSGDCTCPTSGDPGRAGGRPGKGGLASTIISNIPMHEMSNYFTSINGEAGASAGVLEGGRAGLPSGAYKYTHPGHQHRASRENCPTVQKGANVSSPILLTTIVKGEIKEADYLEAMSHSLFVPFKLKFANELFSQGHLLEAKDEYSEIINFAGRFSPQHKSVTLAQSEMLALQKLYNLDLKLDYFGHSPTWIPGLNLSTSRNLYLKQIDDYLEMLYLSTWLQNREANISAQKFAREEAVKRFYQQLENGYATTTKLFEDLPKLKTDLEEMDRDEKLLLARIKELIREIEQTAQDNVDHRQRKKKTKRILLGLCALAKSIPAGQPALGGAASIIDVVLRSQDPEEGFSMLEELPDLAKSISSVTRLKQSEDDWNGKYQKISFSDFKQMHSKERYAYLEKIKDFYSPISKELVNQVQLWKKLDVSPAAIQAEVNAIKASHPVYQEVLARVLNLQERKSKLMKSLAELEQIMGQLEAERIVLSNQITNLQEDINKDMEDLSPESVVLLSQYEQMALDRLKFYRYQMIKAYNYEYLKPSKESLSLDSVWNELKRVVKEEQSVDISADKIRSLRVFLESDLQKMAQQIIEEVSQGKISYVDTSLSFYLSQDQINSLNSGKAIKIDTTKLDFFPQDEEDIRINMIEILEEATLVTQDQAPAKARMAVEINHPGKFYIKKDSELYFFERTDLAQSTQFSWVHVYDGLHSEGFAMIHISPLRSLFSEFPDLNDHQMDFVKPGGLSELEVRTTYYNSTRNDYSIKSMGIKISYSCRRKKDTSLVH